MIFRWLCFSQVVQKQMTGEVGKLNYHLMASYVRNILTKYYQNLIIGFQVTVENVGDAFLGHSVDVIWQVTLLESNDVLYEMKFLGTSRRRGILEVELSTKTCNCSQLAKNMLYNFSCRPTGSISDSAYHPIILIFVINLKRGRRIKVFNGDLRSPLNC